jgi:hypothetical protein
MSRLQDNTVPHFKKLDGPIDFISEFIHPILMRHGKEVINIYRFGRLIIRVRHKVRQLILKEVPYTGDKLRIDGYYYSDPSNLTYGEYSGVAIFYRSGIIIHPWVKPESQNIVHYI